MKGSERDQDDNQGARLKRDTLKETTGENMDKLTAKQRKFVLSYASCGNATQAAIEAGYSKKTAMFIGHENLRKPKIIAALKLLTEKGEKKTIANAARRQTLLTEIIEQKEEKTSDRIKAIEVLGKMQGDFIERHEVKHDLGVVRVPEKAISEEEWLK